MGGNGTVSASAVRRATATGIDAATRRRAPRRIEGLFDLRLVRAPGGELVDPARPEATLDSDRIADLVRRAGGAGDDVRVLLSGAARDRAVFAELAGVLERDVYISPAGARLHYLPGPADTDQLELALVDQVSGGPADWLVIQPPHLASNGPGWFEIAGGRLRPRSGLVTLPLADGIALTTRADFVTRRAATGLLWPGHLGLVTIAAEVRAGAFVVGDYGGGQADLNGVQLAAALGGRALYGAEIRMWLDWPAEAAEHGRLADGLAGLADACGAVVWAPEPGATIEVLDGCHDLGAVDVAGRPAGWLGYRPARAGAPRFAPDADGRLVPAGGVAMAGRSGGPSVGRAVGPVQTMSDRYGRVAGERGLFVVDLAVLHDGRWAARRMDNSVLALGSRECRRMLSGAGWRGEDLALVSTYPPEVATEVRRGATQMFAGLGAEVWSLPPGAQVEAVGDRCRAIDEFGRPVEWRRLTPDPARAAPRWHSREGILRPYPTTAPERTEPAEPAFLWWGLPGPEPRSVPPPDADPLLPSSTAPRLAPAQRRLSHGIYWLADRPKVNAEAVELYVVAGCPPEQAFTTGVPSPHLYLVGLLAPPDPGRLRTGEYLLRVRVEPGGVVDLSSIDIHVPPVVQLMLSAGGQAYLMPGGLLSRARLTAAYAVSPHGRYARCHEFPDLPPLALRFQGARHGIDGLPDDVPRWPRHATDIAYALVEDPRDLLARHWLALSSRLPSARAGAFLLRLRVPRRRAIDVVGTARQLVGLTATRSAVPALTGARVRLVLPRRSYAQVTVERVLAGGSRGWRRVPTGGPVPLALLIESDFLR